MHSHTHGHVQEMGVVTDAEHSKVEVQCHQRRGSGNWPPHISPGPVKIGTILVESNLASHRAIEVLITTGSFSLLGVYPKIIIKKRISYS